MRLRHSRATFPQKNGGGGGRSSFPIYPHGIPELLEKPETSILFVSITGCPTISSSLGYQEIRDFQNHLHLKLGLKRLDAHVLG